MPSLQQERCRTLKNLCRFCDVARARAPRAPYGSLVKVMLVVALRSPAEDSASAVMV